MSKWQAIRIMFVVLAVFTGSSMLHAVPPYYEPVVGRWLAPGVTTATQDFAVPSGSQQVYTFMYSGSVAAATNAQVKVEELVNGSPGVSILNISWPIPAHLISGNLFPVPGHSYRVTLYDNGAHVNGRRRPWLLIYRNK